MALREITLRDLRILARQLADMENSNFVTEAELNTYINLGARELHDKLLQYHGHEYFLKCTEIVLENEKTVYELPDDFVGIKGVDWSTRDIPASSISSGTFPDITTVSYDVPLYDSDEVVPIYPYDFEDRYLGDYFSDYSPAYSRATKERGLQYRVLSSKKITSVAGDNPSTTVEYVNLLRINRNAHGRLFVWYWPEVPKFTNDSDSFPFFQGFEEYPALVAAIMMLSKEESSTRTLQERLNRVEASIANKAANRDVDHPEVMGDVMGGSRGYRG